MTNGQPSSPVPSQPPVKKKTSILVWILGGCGVIVALGLLVALVVGFWVKGKVDAAQRNPVVAAAELMVRANPDLELVSSDYDKGTITIRNKTTREEITMDANDAKNGRFRFRNEKGEEVNISAQGGDSGAGSLSIATKDGNATFGAGTKVDTPSWVPTYPGATVDGVFNTQTPKGFSASLVQKTGDDATRVIDFFDAQLKQGGFQVSTTRASQDGKQSGMVFGNKRAEKRSVTVVIGSEDGRTTASVTYVEGGD